MSTSFTQNFTFLDEIDEPLEEWPPGSWTKPPLHVRLIRKKDGQYERDIADFRRMLGLEVPHGKHVRIDP